MTWDDDGAGSLSPHVKCIEAKITNYAALYRGVTLTCQVAELISDLQALLELRRTKNDVEYESASSQNSRVVVVREPLLFQKSKDNGRTGCYSPTQQRYFDHVKKKIKKNLTTG